MDQHEQKPSTASSEAQNDEATHASHASADVPVEPPAETSGSDDVLDLIENVDRQLERIKAARKVQDAEIASLAERFKAIEQAEEQLKAAQKALEKREAAFEKDREAASAQQDELQQQREAVDAERGELEQVRQSLDEQQASVATQREALENGRDELTAKLEQTEAKVSELMHDLESLNKQLEDQTAAAETAQGELTDLQSQLTERDETIAQQKQKLEIAGKKLTEFSNILNDQAEQLEQAAGAAALVERQQAEIKRLTQQLEEAGNTGLQQHDEQVAALQKELAEAKAAAEASANDAAQQIQAQQSNIDALTQQLEQAQQAQSAETDDAALQQHKQRIAELEQQLADAKNAAQSSNGQAVEQLKVKTDRLRRVAAHLQRRQKRLKGLRRSLRNQNRSAGKNARGAEDQQARAAAIEALHRKREQLVQDREALAATEKTMQRRWAKPRAVVLAGWLIFLIGFNAAASWFAVDQFFSDEHTASMTIEPRGTTRMNAEQIESWQQWHMALVQDDAFLQVLARRNAERRLDAVADVSSLRRLFDQQLSIMAEPGGALVFTLASSDAWQAAAVLEVLATGIATHSSRHASQRGDQSPASARSVSNATGTLRHASIDPRPVSEAEWITMAIIFGAISFVTVLMIGLVYTRLIRAKRMFDEDNAMLAT